MVAQGMVVMGAIHMAVQGITTAARDMEVMGTMDVAIITEQLAVIIITDGLIITTSIPILALETSLFGVDLVFGSGRLGSRHFGSAVFIGDSALVSYFCLNGKSQDGTLQVLPLVTFCLMRLFQLFRSL